MSKQDFDNNLNAKLLSKKLLNLVTKTHKVLVQYRLPLHLFDYSRAIHEFGKNKPE